MRPIFVLLFVAVFNLTSSSSAKAPERDVAAWLKAICGGQWMINEDRHRLVETRDDELGKMRSRSWMIDNCFNRMARDERYFYDAARDELTATIDWSNGEHWECKGKWDLESKTFTWTSPHEGGTRTFSIRMINEKLLEYRIFDIGSDGREGWNYSERRYRLID